MDLALWIAWFLLVTLFTVWFLYWGGDDTILGIFLAGGSPRWSQDGLRLFVGASWVLACVWFVVGLFVPSARLFL